MASWMHIFTHIRHTLAKLSRKLQQPTSVSQIHSRTDGTSQLNSLNWAPRNSPLRLREELLDNNYTRSEKFTSSTLLLYRIYPSLIFDVTNVANYQRYLIICRSVQRMDTRWGKFRFVRTALHSYCFSPFSSFLLTGPLPALDLPPCQQSRFLLCCDCNDDVSKLLN